MESLKVTRDVIMDLLPLYESGEAREETKRLVRKFLAADPDLARRVETLKQARLSTDKSLPPPEVEMESLKRARRLMRTQSSVMAVAIFFTLAPFAFLFQEGRLSWLLIRESPVVGGAYLFTGIVLWIVYFVMRLRLRVL
jgi:hypothetical protein